MPRCELSDERRPGFRSSRCTTGDDVIPIWQELLYLLKADPSGRGRFIPLPVARYGHCSFTTGEVLGAFLLTVSQP